MLIRAQKSAKEPLEKKAKVFQKAFDISEDAIVMLSDTNEMIYANRSLMKLLDLNEDDVGKPLRIKPEIKVKRDWVTLEQLVKENNKGTEEKMQSFLQSELRRDDKDRDVIPINLYIDTFPVGDKPQRWCTIVSIHDLSKEKEKTALNYRHKLTKLPNQAQALHDLTALYSKMHLNDKKLALVLLDIDNFSKLRSIIGYEQANIILIKVADYLDTLAKEHGFSVYHTYHNNFLLVVPDINASKEILSLVQIIQKRLASFYRMEDTRLHLTASVGISIYPDSGSTLNLFDNAYKALNQAENHGFGRVHIYIPSDIQHDYNELILHNEMHEALKKDEFEIYYQPIVEAKTKEVVAAEALIRWNHPKYGIIPPAVFIPLMEKTGFIIELGRYMLEEILRQQKRWELFQFKQIEVSINITLLEIESEGFVENVAKQLQLHQIRPELIKYEITEGSAMISEELTRKQFLALKKLGIPIALDDFGTGYTSFSYLKKFPADVLKIDKTLVDYILTNNEDQRIVKAMIELGHNLGVKIVVEGIENKRMYELIASYGCDYMQGYYFSKPLPVFEFQKLLR
ncbi:bifunctional diguanylate cyclase/phosphodiesterase [Sulfurovum sp.]|nr:bifunctional diguanylate cyclase/phosphodiesterase [Sulfurovum sp.]